MIQPHMCIYTRPAPLFSFLSCSCQHSASGVLSLHLLHTYTSSVCAGQSPSPSPTPFPPWYPYIWPLLVAQTIENLPAIQETWAPSLSPEDSPVEGNRDPLQCSWGFPGGALYACVSISALQMRSFMPFVPLSSYLILPLSFPLLKYSNTDIKFTVRKCLILNSTN